MERTDTRLILLNQADNVFVLAEKIHKGEELHFDTTKVIAENTLDLGHKIARRPIGSGENIIKYGLPVGFAREAIAAGAHVHVHNVASRYTAVKNME